MTNTAVNAATISTLAREVAAQLGPAWRLDTSRLGERDRPVRLTHPDGAQLWLGLDDWTRGARVEISGGYPARLGRDYGLPHHEITVSRARGAQVIAREITRRLLPVYEPDLIRAREIVARHAQEKATREHTAAQIAQVLPGARLIESDARGHVSYDIRLDLPAGAWGSIHLDATGQAANVELYRVPADALARMAGALAAPLTQPYGCPEKGI